MAYTAGQGANLAFEDAAVLAYYLRHKGACEQALRDYEADRFPRLKRIAATQFKVMHQAPQAEGKDYVKLRQKHGEYQEDLHAFDHPCLQDMPLAAAVC